MLAERDVEGFVDNGITGSAKRGRERFDWTGAVKFGTGVSLLMASIIYPIETAVLVANISHPEIFSPQIISLLENFGGPGPLVVSSLAGLGTGFLFGRS
jgi:hypothetical protein